MKRYSGYLINVAWLGRRRGIKVYWGEEIVINYGNVMNISCECACVSFINEEY